MNSEPDRYTSLDAALRDHHLPMENDPQIRHFVTALGITDFYDRGSYIKAARPAGTSGPALQIYYGYTSGFASEDEARMAADGITEHWPSHRGKDVWGVTHLENKIRTGDGSGPGRAHAADAQREACPTCHYLLPASGSCDNCG